MYQDEISREANVDAFDGADTCWSAMAGLDDNGGHALTDDSAFRLPFSKALISMCCLSGVSSSALILDLLCLSCVSFKKYTVDKWNAFS